MIFLKAALQAAKEEEEWRAILQQNTQQQQEFSASPPQPKAGWGKQNVNVKSLSEIQAEEAAQLKKVTITLVSSFDCRDYIYIVS